MTRLGPGAAPKAALYPSLQHLRQLQRHVVEVNQAHGQDDADVDDDEDQYCIVTAKQVSDLLRTTEVTSEDYNTVKALVDGKINTFMGFTFKRISSSMLPKTDNIREIFCYAKSGLLLATAGDIKTDISVRADKRMATQVYASLSCGASRMDEKKVVSISCAEEPKAEGE